MWKKVLVSIIALVGTFSVVYAFNNDLFANTTTYNAGGVATGRVNKAPDNLTLTSGNTSIGMQKGDKVLIGEKNPLDNSQLGFQLLQYHQNYTDYNQNIVAEASNGVLTKDDRIIDNYSFISSTPLLPKSSWFAMSSKAITGSVMFATNWQVDYDTSSSPYFWHGATKEFLGGDYYLFDIDKTNFYINNETLFNNIDRDRGKYKIISDRDLSYIRSYVNSKYSFISLHERLTVQNAQKHNLFLIDASAITKIEKRDLSFDSTYWSDGTRPSRGISNGIFNLPNRPVTFEVTPVYQNGTSELLNNGDQFSAKFRPAIHLDMSNVIFSTSMGTTTGFAEVSQPILSPSYTSIYEETKNDRDMKVRVLNSALSATLNGLKNTSGSYPLKIIGGKSVVAQKSIIQLDANANPWSNSTVSVLVFDKDGNFKYYKPLEAAKGSGNYAFDTTGLLVGEYQIAIVNEVYSDTITIAADSSLISSVQNLEIVDPLEYSARNSSLTYTYKDNVNTSSLVANVSYTNGVGTPSFSLLSDSMSGHGEDYKNFEITTDTTNSTAQIMVKTDAPALADGSLKAGEYSFYVHGVDGNGDVGTVDQKVVINVTQAQGSINITSNKEKEDLMLGKSASGTFSTNNKDTLTPTCEINSDISNALTISDCTVTNGQGTFTVQGDVNYSGNDLPKDITLDISIPATDNYSASTAVQKTFRVYKELNSFAFAKRDLYTTLEVDKGASLGELSVKDGISDYTYALTDESVDGDKYNVDQAVDNKKFEIALVSGESVVKVAEKLGEGQYLIQLKVTDQKGMTLYLPATINVGLVSQSDFNFKDKAGGTIKNEASFTYSASTPKVFAEGGNGTGAITYSVSQKTPTDGSNPQDVLRVDKDSGVLTLLKVGTAYVTAKKSGGSDYSDVSVVIPVTVSEGPQSIAFDENTPIKHLVSQKTFDVHAQVSGRESGASEPGTILYTSLSEGFCTVDNKGEVTIQKAGTCTIKASNSDTNYKQVDDTATIVIYDDVYAEFEQTLNPVNVGTADKTAIGQINNQKGGDGTYTYAMTSDILSVSDAGIVSLEKTLTIDDIKSKWSNEKNHYMISETITMTDGNGYSTVIEVNMLCEGAELNATFNNEVNGTITETYGVGKQITLSLHNNLGDGNVTYTKTTDTSNVLTSLIPNASGGAVAIINKAGDTPAVVTAVIEPKNGYRGQTLSVNVKINKATQTLSFDPALENTMKFEKDKEFTVNAKGQVTGTNITYETKPSTVCSNVNGTITMVGTGKCTITAKGNLENYEEATITSEVSFYAGILPEFNQSAMNLQAKDENIGTMGVPVGTITTTGGLNTSSIRYAISSKGNDENKAKDLFIVSGTGAIANMSLKQDVSADELSLLGVYDRVNDTYLLKVQVDVFDDSDDVADATVNCIVKIKGASFKPTFTYETVSTNTITKTYGENYFDLSLQDNKGEGAVSYAIQSETDIPTDIIRLSGTRVLIDNADDKTPTITANIQANNGYQKMQISTKVKIKKATLSNFDFSETSDELILLGEDVSITPIFTGYLAGATIELSSEKTDVIEVNGDSLSILERGESTISATTPSASDAAYRNYDQKKVTRKYIVYEGLGGNITQTDPSMQVNEESAYADTQVGFFGYENGNGPITSTITEGQDFFYKTEANKLYLKKDILREDIIWDEQTKNYYIPIQITLNDGTGSPVVLEKKITFIGASVPTLTFKDAVDGKISKTYKLNGKHPLDLNDYKDELGNAIYGPVTYRLKTDDTMPTDVVKDIAKIDDVYNVFMGNANAESVTIEAVIKPGNGYEGTIISCAFEITKAQQDFDFKDISINFKKGTTFTPQFSAKPKGNNGVVTLDSGNKNTIRVNGVSLFGVDTGTSLITATAAGNDNFEEKVVTKEASVYDDLTLEFKPEATLPQAGTVSAKAGTTIGTIILEGAQEPKLSMDSTHMDNAFFKITGTTLSLDKDINALDLASKTWNEDKKAYEMKVEFTYSDKNNLAKTSVQTIYIKGAIANVSFKDSDGNATVKIEKPYAQTPFTLELKNNAGDTWTYGDITYELDESTNTTNVLERIDVNGSVYIQNANLVGNPEKVKAIAKVTPANGYEGAQVDCEIYITKAAQPDFAFTSSSINLELPGEVIPEYQGLLSSESLTLTIVDKSIITYDKTTKSIIAQAVGKTQISATTSVNDRNYEVTTTPLIDVNVRNTTGYVLEIEVPGSVTYGDSTELSASIKTDTSKGTQKTQEWFSSKEDVASIDKATGKITIHHAGSTLIHVSQTTNLEPAQDSLSLWFTVKPKSIRVQISNKEKYVGQEVPTFGIDPIEGILESDKDNFIEPLYVCTDTKGNYVDAYTGVGKYAIEGQFVASTNSTNKDYEIKLLPGQLEVKQDLSLPSWYEVQSETQAMDGWYNKPVTLKLVQGDGSYDKISDDMKGPWDESIVVSEEGIQSKDVYFKDTNTNKIASPQEKEIKVDETAPKITSIAGKEINTSNTARFLNMLTLKQFFKAGNEIEITAQDVVPQEGIAVSDIAKIDYKIYRDTQDEDGNTLVKEGSEASANAVIVLDEPDDYTVCAIAYDRAGNATEEACQKAAVKKIDVDVDGDGELDFNDSDEDGCPDLNIKWKDPNDPTKWIVINGDRNYDGIPDLNIDSDGDGKVDLNIDTDGDNSPDVNLVILKKSDWIPSKCVNTEVEEYCTGTSVKPLINVDTDLEDGKIEPELDIDTTGDMKADLNILKDGKISLNILPIKTWNPIVSHTYSEFTYDTMKKTHALTNIDSDGDGRPDLNIDFNNDGVPDLNIDSDFDNLPNLNIDGDGNGIPDYNLDVDDNGKPTRNVIVFDKWTPDQNFEYEGKACDTMVIKKKDQLEDNDITIRPSDPLDQFLPNYSLRVSNITEELIDALADKIPDHEGKIFQSIYRLELFREDELIQPNGKVKIQIPIPEGIENPKLYIETEIGDYEEIEYLIENGYFIIETDFLSTLCILGDEASKEPIEDESVVDEVIGTQESSTYENGMGGSKTGDNHIIEGWLFLLCGAGLFVIKSYRKML